MNLESISCTYNMENIKKQTKFSDIDVMRPFEQRSCPQEAHVLCFTSHTLSMVTIDHLRN